MSKDKPELIDVQCPCCEAKLRIDPETAAVISHEAKVKPPPIEDLSAAVQRIKGESARHEALFEKQLGEQKMHQQVLDRKFDELLKQAKEKPDLTPRVKDIDLD